LHGAIGQHKNALKSMEEQAAAKVDKYQNELKFAKNDLVVAKGQFELKFEQLQVDMKKLKSSEQDTLAKLEAATATWAGKEKTLKQATDDALLEANNEAEAKYRELKSKFNWETLQLTNLKVDHQALEQTTTALERAYNEEKEERIQTQFMYYRLQNEYEQTQPLLDDMQMLVRENQRLVKDIEFRKKELEWTVDGKLNQEDELEDTKFLANLYKQSLERHIEACQDIIASINDPNHPSHMTYDAFIQNQGWPKLDFISGHVLDHYPYFKYGDEEDEDMHMAPRLPAIADLTEIGNQVTNLGQEVEESLANADEPLSAHEDLVHRLYSVIAAPLPDLSNL
jgi:chromosome segregation ATPase